jgi:F-type H+-transporting ATPase subunit epsilon
MATPTKLQLVVVSQDRQLLSKEVGSITAPTTEGEITVLPQHVPLFTQLQTGLLTYRSGKEEEQFVVSKGFMDVGVDGTVTVMVDTAMHARDISLERAEAAVKAAEQTMSITQDRRELLMAEASLRLALLEVKVAQSSKRRMS